MNVLIVSRCSKRALQETCRILDQFAERKGDRTWATPITMAGLDTLRRLLRKSARRNTAVACHLLRSGGPELCWIIGNANRFNNNGTVPTNTTGRDILRSQDENCWHRAEVMALLAGIAGLFHDFGKANQLFQNKLTNHQSRQSEPLRHEWLSLRLFQAFVASRSDKEWLTDLAKITAQDDARIRNNLTHLAEHNAICIGKANPFSQLPAIAKAIGWLIVSHHRLPQFDDKYEQAAGLPPMAELTITSRRVDASWNSPQCRDSHWQAEDWQQLWHFPYGTPVSSATWRAKAQSLARRALQSHTLWQQGDWLVDRFTVHLARLSLMLADHVYSAGPANIHWRDQTYSALANTDRTSKQPKQRLDEHNIGVGQNAYLLAKNLPGLRRYLPAITRHKGFKQRSKNAAFRWQDKAYDMAVSLGKRSQQQGFFGVNMASTGCGKTFANARIMYGLADEKLGCRFSVALGLRTLTLQTGDALATRLKLDSDELAVLIGSQAVQRLHQRHKQTDKPSATASGGSESADALFDDTTHVRYEGALDDGPLRRWLRDASMPNKQKKLNQIVSAPVLISTIDHLIPATEGTRGGKQIAPMLRLLSSDLVLDEPDDFGLADLPALCRLVNWAGMLGSRVLLSSATLPPALINALFAAYQAGREHFHRACGETGDMPPICCGWFDEFSTQSQDIAGQDGFKQCHKEFVTKRLGKLAGQPALRHAQLWPVISANSSATAVAQGMADAIGQGIISLHQQHHMRHRSGKCLSVGLVRMANIDKLVSVSQQLLSREPAPDTRIHFCVYHSHHPLLVRSEMEKQLDNLLSRHNEEDIWQQPLVKQTFSQSETHHIFLVFASPVAEVGRDHDYDWAIAEPSSMRSLIQLAGRLQRHRKQPPATPNMLILSQNFNALQGRNPAYCRPGFESAQFQLADADMQQSLPPSCYQWISSAPAIQLPPKVSLKGPYERLDALEHAHLHVKLFGRKADKKPDTPPAQDWWAYPLDWAGEMQRQTRFRISQPDELFVLYQLDETEPLLFHRVEDDGELVLCEQDSFTRQQFVTADRVVPLLENQVGELLAELAVEMAGDREEADMEQLSRMYTEIRLPVSDRVTSVWLYDPLFGIHRALI